jgi:PAS domain S-box-containing protein
MPVSAPALDAGARPSLELQTYRLVCLLAAWLLPAFGYAYHAIDATFYDPLWMRWGLGGAVLALGAGTYASAWVRARLNGLGLLLAYALVGWFVLLTAKNHLAPEYALGYLFVMIMLGAATLAMERLRAMVLLLSATVAAGIAVAFTLPSPGVSPLIYALCLVAGGGIICTGTWLRLRMRGHVRASEARYRTVFENSPTGLFLTDADSGRFLHANEAYLAITGYTLAELRARTLRDIVDAKPSEVEGFAREVLQHGRLAVGEQRHRRRDGTWVTLEIGITRIEQEGRTVFCSMAHDLTEQRAIRAELHASKVRAEDLLDLKSSFLNNMSHELRTPLVSILGFAELLTDETDGEVGEIAATIHRSAKRLHDTLGSVLDLAQLESGSVQFEPEVVDVGAEMKRTVNQLRPAAESKGLAVRVKTSPDAHVLANTVAVRRVLTHLLTNAIKFTERGGVGLDVEADSHRVLVRVSDTGIGISSEFLPYLFGEFEQASMGMDRSYEGSGLGLSITKRLVDLMGGRIMVHSSKEEGTTFVVAFPRSWVEEGSSAEDPAPAEERRAPAVLTSRPRALVVEDNADTRRLIALTLEPYYDVEPTANAEEALALARRAWFDVLLIDVNLGTGLSGLDLLRELRAMSAYAYVPALAVTALTHPHDRERILNHGFDGYLAKPFTRREMVEATDGVLALEHRAGGDGSAAPDYPSGFSEWD